MPISQLLVGNDFSPCAKAALDFAVELAAPVSASIVLLHAYELPVYPLVDAAALALAPSDIQALEGSIDEGLEAERKRAASRGVEITCARSLGPPAEAIIRRAAQEHSDLVVVGAHGRTGLKRWLLGSVAERVTRAAPCPVLVVRDKS